MLELTVYKSSSGHCVCADPNHASVHADTDPQRRDCVRLIPITRTDLVVSGSIEITGLSEQLAQFEDGATLHLEVG